MGWGSRPTTAAVATAETRSAELAAASLATDRFMELIGAGRTNAEIAATLYMAEGTVKTHIGRLLTKLEAANRVQVALVRRSGLGDEHLARHPEVDDEAELAVEVEPQVLPPTARALDPPTDDRSDEIVGAGEVTARDAVAAQLEVADPPSGDVVGEAPADDLDLGQLRHAESLTQTGRKRTVPAGMSTAAPTQPGRVM